MFNKFKYKINIYFFIIEKKRPAWDLKGRLQDMEKILKENCEKINNYDIRMTSLEEEKNLLQKNLAETQTHSNYSQEEINRLEKYSRYL